MKRIMLETLAKPAVIQSSTGILPMLHGRDAHATSGFAKTPLIMSVLICVFAFGLPTLCMAQTKTGKSTLPTLPTRFGNATAVGNAPASPGKRIIPKPLPNHPGNVFLQGEEVVITLPDSKSAWRLVDYDDKELTVQPAGGGSIKLGKLPVGFYRLFRKDAPENDAGISLAVIAQLKAPTPLTSPICTDAAMTYHSGGDAMPQIASLAALAGINRIRDRFSWPGLEPQKGNFSKADGCDASAKAQCEAGLQVLFVNHVSPGWVFSSAKDQKWALRFPPDLRDAYNFHLAMARRLKGRAVAFEPWNESDLSTYGGHTGSERAAMQKASYLGMKAGDPEVTACLCPLAYRYGPQLEDFADNEVWPYFDTYNLHHYDGFSGYPRLYAADRAVSAGRPMWVSECGVQTFRWPEKNPPEEPNDKLKLQSEYVARFFATSLHEGAKGIFFFFFGFLNEGGIQYGIFRKDRLPRPAYVALAAVGRLLADAKPIGKLRNTGGPLAYAFKAKPDGKDMGVVVAWAGDNPDTGTLQLPYDGPVTVFDHLGRSIGTNAAHLAITTAPVYVILPESVAAALPMDTPIAAPPFLEGKPVPVVLQSLWPQGSSVDKNGSSQHSAYGVAANAPTETKLVVYNFGPKAASGNISATPPKGWNVEGLEKPVKVDPMGRVELPIRLVPSSEIAMSIGKIRFEGNFGDIGKAVASIMISPHTGN